MSANGAAAKQVRRRKLSDEQVRAIRAAPAGGAALARQYGVSEKTIWRIRAGRAKQGLLGPGKQGEAGE